MADDRYWSSSESSSDYGWYVDLYLGFVSDYFKDNNLRVRFVRDF